jgi:hypothetical protein
VFSVVPEQPSLHREFDKLIEGGGAFGDILACLMGGAKREELGTCRRSVPANLGPDAAATGIAAEVELSNPAALAASKKTAPHQGYVVLCY